MKNYTLTCSLISLALLGACSAEAPPAEDGIQSWAAASANAAAPASEIAVRIGQAERLLARGGDAHKAKALLDQALADPAITPEERSQAILAASRAYETLGDKERAIAVIEQELAKNAENRDWRDEAFEKRLRFLLTGSETAPGPRLESEDKVAPFAHVLLRYFPRRADGTLEASFYMAGGSSEVSDQLGTFNVGGALRAERQKECPLCDEDVRVNRSTRQSNWLILPRLGSKFEDAVAVYYFDLERDRIPARYESHLPLKVAEIERQLAAGKSFVVAKERPGAPPALLLAAPRAVMLREVEAKLAALSQLPTEPVYVEVDAGLRPNEIQGVVRAQWFNGIKRCYETLLKTSPAATGSIKASFAINQDGKVENARIDADDASLSDDFVTCVKPGLQGLKFPATGQTKTVTYPVKLSP